MEAGSARRPLKSRSQAWASYCAAVLTRAGVTPNAISAASILMAALGAAGFIAAGQSWLPLWPAMVMAAVFTQLRLVCNLLDGMVAVEGGKGGPTGGIWNELPDRFADTLLLVGAGFSCGSPWAGACAAWAAVMTAYVRSLGAELTGVQDFRGPLAKPQRMAMLTVAALLTPAEFLVFETRWLLPVVLWVIAVGALLTLALRVRRMAEKLNQTHR